MENIFLIYLVSLIFVSFSAREKKWRLKRVIFLNLLPFLFFGFLFYKSAVDKHSLILFSLFSIGSCVLGYFLRPIGRFFKKGMEASHSSADVSDEEEEKDYKW